MNKRSLMQSMAVFFTLPLWRWSSAKPSIKHIYAEKGETVTCENGHPICDFVQTVDTGTMQNLPKQLGNWRQDEPVVGTFPIPSCALCGARFTDGSHFHIGPSWRDPFGHLKG